MAHGTFIAYYRVSTAKQGQSGLGLEAQKAAVTAYLNGGSWILAGEFTEVESGKHNDRPQLAMAIAEAKRRNATLLVAKLDRLSRNAAFLLKLQESAARFVACDMPEANNFMVGIMALVAQQEREAISARTKAALAAKKAQGKVLGSPANLTPAAAAKGRIAASVALTAKADNFASDYRAILAGMIGKSLREKATLLNQSGYTTPRGKAFTAQAVKNLEARL